jgi:hypothetical protein
MSGAGEGSRRRRERDSEEDEVEFVEEGGKELQVVTSFETMGLREELLVSGRRVLAHSSMSLPGADDYHNVSFAERSVRLWL